MDVIEKFLPYVEINPSRLHVDIAHSYGVGLARRYSAWVDELSKLRMSTLGAVSVGADGGVQVVNQPGMSAIQAKITELEPKIARVLEISHEIGAILESEGCDPTNSDTDLGAKIRSFEQQTQIAPPLWQRFNILKSGRPTALPSDIVKSSEYATLEAELMLRREEAAAQIAPLREKGATIATLVDEAMSL